jgi:hypothetical protein
MIVLVRRPKRWIRLLLLITASMRQLMEEAELLQMAIRVKQARDMSCDRRTIKMGIS